MINQELDTDLVGYFVGRPPLFWEVRPERIATVLRENDDWVIVRVFEYGTIEDILEVIELYGRDKCIEVLSREKLKPMTASMAYLFLGVDRYGKHRAL
jgi:hypothetical protein